MKVQHYKEVAPIQVEEIESAAEGITIRRVISEVDGAGNFIMDIFEMRPGGHSGFHTHPWEHEVFVLQGQGKVVGPEGETPFRQGDVIFVQAEEPHQFCSTGGSPLEFICLIPKAALTAYYLERIRFYKPPGNA